MRFHNRNFGVLDIDLLNNTITSTIYDEKGEVVGLHKVFDTSVITRPFPMPEDSSSYLLKNILYQIEKVIVKREAYHFWLLFKLRFAKPLFFCIVCLYILTVVVKRCYTCMRRRKMDHSKPDIAFTKKND